MLYIVKAIATIIIPMMMQLGVANLVSTDPQEAVVDFLDGLWAGEQAVMEKHIDNRYVNFLVNVQGDEEVIDAMNEALFLNFTYEVEELSQKNDVAVARVTVRNTDFSGVEERYDAAAYEYVMANLYDDAIADKEALAAQCLKIYVEQIEELALQAAESQTLGGQDGENAGQADAEAAPGAEEDEAADDAAGAGSGAPEKAIVETVVFIPLVDDGYYGWNVAVDDALMQAVLGNLALPVE